MEQYAIDLFDGHCDAVFLRYLCLLYTSDAADDGESVDLGGRRIIKKNFFKQKTAYEIMPSLVGSEMCIRDRWQMDAVILQFLAKLLENGSIQLHQGYGGKEEIQPVSYTHLTLPTTERV